MDAKARFIPDTWASSGFVAVEFKLPLLIIVMMIDVPIDPAT